MISVLKKILPPVLALISLLLPAIINGYPLLSEDTATYLYSGKEGFMPADRPYYYGLFLRHTSMNYSLWFVLVVQAALCYVVIYLFIKKSLALTTQETLLRASTIVILLSLASSLGVFASNAMPDLFTGMGFLAIITLLFFHVNRGESVFLWAIFLFSLSTHVSHVPIYGLTTGFILVGRLFVKQTRSLKFLIKPLIILASCLLFLPSLNFLFFGKFITTESSYIFIMGKMAQHRVLQKYLAAHCPDAPPDLCAIPAPDSPSLFVWGPGSPVYELCPPPGTNIENEQLYTCLRYKNPIYMQTLLNMLRDKTVRSDMIKIFLTDGAQEFFLYKTEDLFFDPYPKNMNVGVYSHLTFIFPNEVPQIRSSTQFNGQLDFALLNNVILVFLVFCAIVSLVLSFVLPATRKFYLLLLFFLLANAYICGGLSDVIQRYQARVWWLLPLFTAVFTILWIEQKKRVRN